MSETNIGSIKEPRRKKSKISPLKRRENLTALAFISVKYLGLILFTILPVIMALLYSFTDYVAVAETESFFTRIDDLWCGFDNYKKLFTHINYATYFKNAVLNNLIFMISVPFGIFIGLVVAVMLSRENRIHGSRVIRTLIYVPVVSSAVAMNIIWRYMFDNQYGIINQLFGMEINWLTDETWIKVAIIIKSAWGSIGRTMILCLAALTNVGADYYEAADLDGAGEITKFLKISLPLISPTLFYLFCTGFINNLQSYVDSQVFANGHFGAQTIVYYIWNFGINRSYYGIASAASFILTIGIMVITFVQFKIQNKWVYGE
ncbi:MAG: sugar ABC transporter permease [Clostridia bacterium]|nr:sugar ABC transporter permease [Clostridia bacterium]